MLSFPDSGVLQFVAWYDAGHEVGSLVSFDEEGFMISERRVLDPEHQISRQWYPDGTLSVYSEWRDDTMEGWFRGWHPNGQLKMEGIHKASQRDGIWRFWSPDGHPTEIVTYEMGRELSRESLQQ